MFGDMAAYLNYLEDVKFGCELKSNEVFFHGEVNTDLIDKDSTQGKEILSLISDEERPVYFSNEVIAIKPDNFSYGYKLFENNNANLHIYDESGNVIQFGRLYGSDFQIDALIAVLQADFPTKNVIKGHLVKEVDGLSNILTTAFRFNLTDKEKILIYTKPDGTKVTIKRGDSPNPSVKYGVTVIQGEILNGEPGVVTEPFEAFNDLSTAKSYLDAIKSKMNNPAPDNCTFPYLAVLHETFHDLTDHDNSSNILKTINLSYIAELSLRIGLEDSEQNSLSNQLGIDLLSHTSSSGYEAMFEKSYFYAVPGMDEEHKSKITVVSKDVFHYGLNYQVTNVK